MSGTGQFDSIVRVRCLPLPRIQFYLNCFSGTSFPINPLELTTLQTIVENGHQWTVCVNAIQPQLAVGSGDLDFLLGDIFMRNVYSMCVFLSLLISLSSLKVLGMSASISVIRPCSIIQQNPLQFSLSRVLINRSHMRTSLHGVIPHCNRVHLFMIFAD